MFTYNRRPVPDSLGLAAKGFFDPELIRIAHALKDTQAAIPGNTAVTPGTYGDATHIPQITVGADGRLTAASNIALASGATVVKLAADIANNSSTTNLGSGLKANVVAGTAYTFRWWLWITGSSTGGCIPLITHPAYTSAFTHQKGTSTGTTTFAESVLTTTTSPLTLSTVVSFAGTGWLRVEHTFVPSASGTVEFAFKPASAGQTITIRAGSILEVF